MISNLLSAHFNRCIKNHSPIKGSPKRLSLGFSHSKTFTFTYNLMSHTFVLHFHSHMKHNFLKDIPCLFQQKLLQDAWWYVSWLAVKMCENIHCHRLLFLSEHDKSQLRELSRPPRQHCVMSQRYRHSCFIFRQAQFWERKQFMKTRSIWPWQGAGRATKTDDFSENF